MQSMTTESADALPEAPAEPATRVGRRGSRPAPTTATDGRARDETAARPAGAGRAQAVLLLAGSVLLAIYLLGLDASQLLDAARAFPLGTALAILALNLLPGLLKTARWRWLLGSAGVKSRLVPAYLAINAGFFLGLVTPGTAGELARAFSVPEARGRGLVIVTFEKVVDLVVLLGLAVAAAVAVALDGAVVWAVIATGLTVSALAYAVLVRRAPAVASVARRARGLLPARLQDRVDDALQGLGGLATRPATMAVAATVSLALWLVPFAQMWLIFRGLGLDAPLSLIAGSYFLPYLVGILSMIPLGIGSFDLSLSAVFGRYGVGGPVVGITPLLYRVLVSLPLIAFGYGCQLAMTKLASGEDPWT